MAPTKPSTPTPQQILRWWELRYGELTPEMRRRFLAKPEIKELTPLSSRAVRTAVESSPKLERVLFAAKIIQASYKQNAKKLVADLKAQQQAGSPSDAGPASRQPNL